MADLSDLYGQRFLDILAAHSPEERNKWGLGAGSADFLGDWNARKGDDKTGVFNLAQEGAYLKENPADVTKTFSQQMSTFDPSAQQGFFDHTLGNLATGFEMTPDVLAGKFNAGITAADESYQGTTSDDLFGYISSQLPSTEVTEALAAEVSDSGGILGVNDDDWY